MLKKALIFVCTIFLMVFVTGCQKPYDYQTAFKILSDFSHQSITGYDLSIKQFSGTEIVNSDEIAYRMDNSSAPKAYIITNSKRLNHFGDEITSQFSQTVYYFNGKIGEQSGEDEVVWKDGSQQDFYLFLLADFDIDDSLLTNITHKSKGNSLSVTANVDSNLVVDMFKISNNEQNIKNATLLLTVDATQNKLIQLKINYEGELTHTVIEYNPIYSSQEVIIP